MVKATVPLTRECVDALAESFEHWAKVCALEPGKDGMPGVLRGVAGELRSANAYENRVGSDRGMVMLSVKAYLFVIAELDMVYRAARGGMA